MWRRHNNFLPLLFVINIFRDVFTDWLLWSGWCGDFDLSKQEHVHNATILSVFFKFSCCFVSICMTFMANFMSVVNLVSLVCFFNYECSCSTLTTYFIDLFFLNFTPSALQSLIRAFVINFRYNISVDKLAVYVVFVLVYVCVYCIYRNSQQWFS